MSSSTATTLDYELDRIKHESTRHVRDILLQQHHHQEQALLTLQAHLERALRTKQEALQLAANSDALRLQSEARCHDLETVVSREEMHSQQLREELEATRQELHGTCQALRRQEELVEELSAQLRQLVQENDRQRQSMMEEVRSRQALLNEIQLGRAAPPPQPQRPSSNEPLLASQQGNSTAAAAASSSASGSIYRPAATSNDGAMMIADGEGPPRQQQQDDPRYPTTASINASLRSADVHRQETVTPTVDRRRIVGSSGHGGGGVSSSGSGGARWVDPAFLSRLPQARATLDSTPSSMQQQQKSHVPSSFPDAEKQRRDGSSTMSLLHPQDEGQQRGNYRSTAASFSSSSLLLLRSPVVPSDLRHPPPR